MPVSATAPLRCGGDGKPFRPTRITARQVGAIGRRQGEAVAGSKRQLVAFCLLLSACRSTQVAHSYADDQAENTGSACAGIWGGA